MIDVKNPCLLGKIIFAEKIFKSYLIQLNNLVSCSHDIFNELYCEPTLNLSEYCQAMPYSESDFSSQYGFLERQLKLCLTALKIRRGMLFPKNAGAETIAAEEPQWTYAIFTVSLLKNIYKLEYDRNVILHTENTKTNWLPLSGPLYKRNSSYSMEFIKQKSGSNTDITMASISDRIIPPAAFRWLKNNAVLFNLWWESILHQPKQNNPIESAVQIAAEKSGIALI